MPSWTDPNLDWTASIEDGGNGNSGELTLSGATSYSESETGVYPNDYECQVDLEGGSTFLISATSTGTDGVAANNTSTYFCEGGA